MVVTSGLSAQDPEGRWRKVHVTLDEGDLALMLAEGKVQAEDVQTIVSRFKVLVNEAEMLVIYESAKLELIGAEEAKARIEALV